MLIKRKIISLTSKMLKLSFRDDKDPALEFLLRKILQEHTQANFSNTLKWMQFF